jgi:pSer/pThr/pTyr-binding forkhead associated (FHA) protein
MPQCDKIPCAKISGSIYPKAKVQAGMAERPVLIINQGDKAGQRWTVQSDLVVLGRGNECDLLLPEPQVSRQHIKIKQIAGQYVLEDLDSKNGTWVNGQQVKGERVLRDGDEINVALAVTIVFVESEATAPVTLNDTAGSTRGGIGRLRLDRDSRRVFVTGKEIDPPLSLPQYRLLELLVDSKGGVCTRDQVIEAVWPEVVGEGVSEQAIDALVRRLRDRIAEVDEEHQYIVTVRGHGFRLDQG